MLLLLHQRQRVCVAAVSIFSSVGSITVTCMIEPVWLQVFELDDFSCKINCCSSHLHCYSPSLHQNTSPKWLSPSFHKMSWCHPGRAKHHLLLFFYTQVYYFLVIASKTCSVLQVKIHNFFTTLMNKSFIFQNNGHQGKASLSHAL